MTQVFDAIKQELTRKPQEVKTYYPTYQQEDSFQVVVDHCCCNICQDGYGGCCDFVPTITMTGKELQHALLYGV